ncbi:hypothetical protein [Alcaligenes faecalis]|uniref:hypothetical protein n=1 Tax=Alcaligenes faecalis TaxID=511 RepID=UPI001EEF8352|nr:hypothetical protein [Alcaligenes faecalis]ULH06466.1 hypothetical protein MF263_17575 [Alcaligenes faecalis]
MLTAVEIIAAFVAAISFFLPLIGLTGWWVLLGTFSGAVVVLCEAIKRNLPSTYSARFKSENDKIQHRERLRHAVREEILRCRFEKLRQDVIVRDVRRLDHYPEVKEKTEGISPWFRVDLVDTYHRGIVVLLQIGGLKKCEGGYRFVDRVNGEVSDEKAFLMGDIPYDSISDINFEGDEYYSFPHIYCHFDFNTEPYERLWFAEKIEQSHGHPYFKEIATYKEVVKNNPTEGELSFY